MNKSICDPILPSSQTNAYDQEADQPGVQDHAAIALVANGKDQLPQMQREEYTVGWICALPVEMAAAREMIDEAHNDLEYNENEEYMYSLRTIAGHNVVIICLSAGRTGNLSMAIMATQVMAIFEGIRYGLVVGIVGGVSSAKSDVRLGDVVVSIPRGTFGGVVQHDAGRMTPSGFERMGSLNSPPKICWPQRRECWRTSLGAEASYLCMSLKLVTFPASSARAQVPTFCLKQRTIMKEEGDAMDVARTCERFGSLVMARRRRR
jgi:hypothetical protein